jgi:hypothetical protein
MAQMQKWLSVSFLVLCAVVALAVFALWSSLDPGPPEPSQRDWEAAKAVIQDELQPGDGIRVHPFWLRDAASVLSTLNIEGQALGIVDLSLPPDPMFAARHKNLWIVSAMGREDLPVPSPFAPFDFEKKISDTMTVRRYPVQNSPLVLDLLKQLSTAAVERWIGSGKRTRCRWIQNRHKCPGEAWQDLRVEHKEVGGSPRRCLVMHPFPDQGTVGITFPNVTFSKGILVRSGFTLEAARRAQGSDANVVFRVNGLQVASRVASRNAWEWAPTWIETAHLQGQSGTFSIEVSAVKQDYRELCLDAYLLSRPLQE